MTRVLRIVPPGDVDLANAAYLAEYDAIEVAPYWYALFREIFTSASGPGTDDGLPDEPFQLVYGTLYRRAEELEAFFRLGGLLVAWLYEPAYLESDRGGRADTHWWFMSRIAFPGKWPGVDVFGLPGHGSAIAVLEPTHPLGAYLELRDAYVARVSPYVRNYPGVTVLAENRAGDPVAIEVRVDRGAILLVPPPITTEQERVLTEAVTRSVAVSTTRSRTWTVAEERDAEARRDTALKQLHEERLAAESLLSEVRRVKATVLDEPLVRRAITYLEAALRPANPLDRRIAQLYKLVELMEDYTNAGERGLGDALGVDPVRIKRLKRLANTPSHDLRHGDAAEPSHPDSSGIQDAMATGQLLVGALVELRYRSRRSAVASESAASG